VRGDILDVTEKLVVEICCECHMLFGVPEAFYDRRNRDKACFYCPNGHQQHYTGKSDAQKLREANAAREDAQRRATAAEDAQARLLRQRDKAQKDLKASQRRAEATVCPHCPRSFIQLQRHIKTKHPDKVKAK
jgi:hypothetical protein